VLATTAHNATLTNANYYLAIATVLPLLFIAWILSPDTPASWDRLREGLAAYTRVLLVVTIVITLWIGLAEFAALDVLRNNRATTIDSVLVDGGISLAALGLLVPVMAWCVKELHGSKGVTIGIWIVVTAIWAVADAYFIPASHHLHF
jgi:hypothetical protein